ncbi:MAG: hypothetical protein KGJ97_10580 [Xanthomonadaceae bacterium]|jgi:hypothetical protein|nr:hypothetical protein [Xanthomonadaceae bacterium]MDE3073710.1 hypothetical protein [Pseudomonadota bacterium]
MPAASKIAADGASAWYRQPVLWLGIVVFVLSLAGCVWIIVVSTRHAAAPLDTSRVVFGVPVTARSSHPPPPDPTP